MEGQDKILRYGTAAGEEPLLDTLASLARTALDDPAGLDIEWGGGDFASSETAQRAYAISRLDDIINALNPSEETTTTFAATLTILGRHLAERRDYMAATDFDPETLVRSHEAVLHIDAALDAIDRAVDTLSLGPCEECGTFGVDTRFKGQDGRSVCDDCRDGMAS